MKTLMFIAALSFSSTFAFAQVMDLPRLDFSMETATAKKAIGANAAVVSRVAALGGTEFWVSNGAPATDVFLVSTNNNCHFNVQIEYGPWPTISNFILGESICLAAH